MEKAVSQPLLWARVDLCQNDFFSFIPPGSMFFRPHYESVEK